MPGLVPGIHVFMLCRALEVVGGRYERQFY